VPTLKLFDVGTKRSMRSFVIARDAAEAVMIYFDQNRTCKPKNITADEIPAESKLIQRLLGGTRTGVIILSYKQVSGQMEWVPYLMSSRSEIAERLRRLERAHQLKTVSQSR
jgi:hypothetical protein